MNTNSIKVDLIERGFVSAENGMMTFAEGSISNYKKCSVCLGYRLWGDMAEQWFYSVRFESFAESGQPELDHHTVSEVYIAESKIADYLRGKGILTKAEREAKWVELRKRMKRSFSAPLFLCPFSHAKKS